MRLAAASSPHLHSGDNVKVTMGDVLIVLIPLLVVAVYYYGWRCLVLTLVSVVSCVVFEYLYRRIMRRSRSIGDLSAMITGVLISFCMPASAPLWMPVAGALFAIILVKQLYGGIGKNIFNPAAAAVVFLTVTWQGIMGTFPMAFENLPLFQTPGKFQTGVTVLSSLRSGNMPDNLKYEMLLGYTPGNLGTGCILVICVAAAYLLYRRIISWQIPAAFLGTVAAAALLFPRCPSGRLDSVFYELTSGSLVFAVVFMATDPVTSPVTGLGRLLYGFLCGLFTVLIRCFGNYPEGVFFAILLVNPFVVELDRLAWKLRVKGGRLLYARD